MISLTKWNCFRWKKKKREQHGKSNIKKNYARGEVKNVWLSIFFQFISEIIFDEFYVLSYTFGFQCE